MRRVAALVLALVALPALAQPGVPRPAARSSEPSVSAESGQVPPAGSSPTVPSAPVRPEPRAGTGEGTAPSPQGSESERIDPTKLGISLDRIQQRLVAAAHAAEKFPSGSPLRIEFQVQVYGTAPRIDILQGFDLRYGPVPGTAPSHQEMLSYWTPQIFSAPPFPIATALYWLGDQLRRKSAKAACEEELRDYRALIMQGVNVAAPRCAAQ